MCGKSVLENSGNLIGSGCTLGRPNSLNQNTTLFQLQSLMKWSEKNLPEKSRCTTFNLISSHSAIAERGLQEEGSMSSSHKRSSRRSKYKPLQRRQYARNSSSRGRESNIRLRDSIRAVRRMRK